MNLRTIGSLHTNYAGWVLEGSQESAARTKIWKSVTGPVLVVEVGDKFNTILLDKVIPGPLHLFLSFNELVNFSEKKIWPEIKAFFYEIAGVQVMEEVITNSHFDWTRGTTQ